MSTSLRSIALLILVFNASAAFAVRDPTPEQEKSLIQAWETAQRSDPKTRAFEQISAGVYHLKTERFPYDGKVVIHPVINFYGSTTQGAIEVTLDVDSASLMRDHPQSYGQWQQHNMFFLDDKSGRWLDMDQWRDSRVAGSGAWPFTALAWGVPGILVLIVLGLVFLAIRNTIVLRKRIREARESEKRIFENNATIQARQQKILELTEEQTQLLRTIADELRKANGGATS